MTGTVIISNMFSSQTVLVVFFSQHTACPYTYICSNRNRLGFDADIQIIFVSVQWDTDGPHLWDTDVPNIVALHSQMYSAACTLCNTR